MPFCQVPYVPLCPAHLPENNCASTLTTSPPTDISSNGSNAARTASRAEHTDVDELDVSLLGLEELAPVAVNNGMGR